MVVKANTIRPTLTIQLPPGMPAPKAREVRRAPVSPVWGDLALVFVHEPTPEHELAEAVAGAAHRHAAQAEPQVEPGPEQQHEHGRSPHQLADPPQEVFERRHRASPPLVLSA